MRINHCGREMAQIQRALKPNAAEAARGITALEVRTHWCTNRACTGRHKVYYRREILATGVGDWRRVKRGLRSLVSRLRHAVVAQWVWGHHPVTYAKVKRTVT